MRNIDVLAMPNRDDQNIYVEIGTHDELLKRRGHYYNLVKAQLELDD